MSIPASRGNGRKGGQCPLCGVGISAANTLQMHACHCWLCAACYFGTKAAPGDANAKHDYCGEPDFRWVLLWSSTLWILSIQSCC